mmetsp:Transcript_8565/g.37771  ORF Transcript_8565/g.37771 Transcript_8565/m.37771 type:complete len:267 (-) Transcript_8565:480-1280(-)
MDVPNPTPPPTPLPRPGPPVTQHAASWSTDASDAIVTRLILEKPRRPSRVGPSPSDPTTAIAPRRTADDDEDPPELLLPPPSDELAPLRTQSSATESSSATNELPPSKGRGPDVLSEGVVPSSVERFTFANADMRSPGGRHPPGDAACATAATGAADPPNLAKSSDALRVVSAVAARVLPSPPSRRRYALVFSFLYASSMPLKGRRKSTSVGAATGGGRAVGSFSSFDRAGASPRTLARMTTALCCLSDSPPSPSPVIPASSPAAR